MSTAKSIICFFSSTIYQSLQVDPTPTPPPIQTLVYGYILSLSKTENGVEKKKLKKKKRSKKRQKKFPTARVEPRTSDVCGQHVIYCARTTNTFSHEILTVDVV